MYCPNCNHPDTQVIDSRSRRDGREIRRRRSCPKCGHRFTTYERHADEKLPLVIKGDGRREPFSREKLMQGIQKACQKRDISITEIDKAVSRIVRKLQELDREEIPARNIGEYVMDQLADLDDVAYIRFASVYWRFDDISEFTRHVEELKRRKNRPR